MNFARMWLLVVFVAISCSAREADACCRHLQTRGRDRAVRLIGRAERHFDAGDYQTTLRLLESPQVPIRSARLERHRMALIAVSLLRTGRVTAGVARIRRLLRDRPHDPYLTTRLAEGLSMYRAERQKQHALRILEGLEARGEIADARGVEILASLRRQAD